MKSLLPQKVHYYIYIFALVLLAVGLPMSKFLLSLSQIILAANWLLEGGLKQKLRSFFGNKAALVASSILVLHFIGLLYTSDFEYAFKDIRIKTPLFILPLLLSTSHALPEKIKHLILKFFILSLFVNTVITFLIGANVIHRNITDMRFASIFLSHIRLSLLVSVAIFSCVYLWREDAGKKWRMFYIAFVLWFLFFLIFMGYITGLSALFITVIVIGVYQLFKVKNKVLKYSIFVILAVGSIYVGNFIYSTYNRYSNVEIVDVAKLEKNTIHGNPYTHYGINVGTTESGRYVWNYFCEQELKDEWNKRSKFDYNWKDKRGGIIRYTLARFLTSKDLRKDAEGLKQLTEDEIRAIEKGIANADFLSPISGRVCEIVWELETYRETNDANGHSITQRFEFWKAATAIISEHPVFGVGTGDIQNAFTEQYNKTNSALDKDSRLRSHNQYLSIAVAFGLFGLLWFLIALVYPAIKLGKFSDLLYLSFFIVAIVSFLSEDTLETQIGVTFYAFLNAFFLFVMKEEQAPSTTK